MTENLTIDDTATRWSVGGDAVREAVASLRSRLGSIADGSLVVQRMALPGVSCVLS